MSQFSASFTIEAASLEEAEQLVMSWTVTAGTVLQSLTGIVSSETAPVVVNADGLISDGEPLLPPEPPEPAAEPAPELPPEPATE
jgi:hypothetical protein